MKRALRAAGRRRQVGCSSSDFDTRAGGFLHSVWPVIAVPAPTSAQTIANADSAATRFAEHTNERTWYCKELSVSSLQDGNPQPS